MLATVSTKLVELSQRMDTKESELNGTKMAGDRLSGSPSKPDKSVQENGEVESLKQKVGDAELLRDKVESLTKDLFHAKKDVE